MGRVNVVAAGIQVFSTALISGELRRPFGAVLFGIGAFRKEA